MFFFFHLQWICRPGNTIAPVKIAPPCLLTFGASLRARSVLYWSKTCGAPGLPPPHWVFLLPESAFRRIRIFVESSPSESTRASALALLVPAGVHACHLSSSVPAFPGRPRKGRSASPPMMHPVVTPVASCHEKLSVPCQISQVLLLLVPHCTRDDEHAVRYVSVSDPLDLSHALPTWPRVYK